MERQNTFCMITGTSTRVLVWPEQRVRTLYITYRVSYQNDTQTAQMANLVRSSRGGVIKNRGT